MSSALHERRVDAEGPVRLDVGPHPRLAVAVLDPQEPRVGEPALAADALAQSVNYGNDAQASFVSARRS